MTREEVKKLFKLIVMIYPHFEVTSSKLDTWTRLMKGQNPKRVMFMAERYAKTNRFPPTIADLSERIDETRNSDFLEKVKRWEREAGGKPRS